MPVLSRAARAASLLLAVVVASGAVLVADPAGAVAATLPPKVAIIVGPVGPDITPRYIELGNEVAREAADAGARVAKAFSPRATAANVLRAVQGANIIVYLGHGNGYPNPYSSVLNPDKVNGWGLQGPNAKGTHADSWADGTLKYYGEAWIRANARPARNFVMIYSQACYAAGSSEGHLPPSTWSQARARAGYYSRTPIGPMKGSAYYATNHGDAGALVGRLLRQPGATYAEQFAAGRGFSASTLRTFDHAYATGEKLWLSPRKRSDGKFDFGYALAGNPGARPSGVWRIVADQTAPVVLKRSPGPNATRVSRTAAVSVYFDESVTRVSTSSVVLRDTKTGRVVPATVSYSRVALKATLRPAQALAGNRVYKVRLTGAIRNLDGLRISPIVWSFKTRS